MLFPFENCTLRPLLVSDAAALTRHGNSYAVWRSLRDRFPHPLTTVETERYIVATLERGPETTFAIEVQGEPIGVIGLAMGTGERRCVAELSYWLGEQFWGRGIITEAIPLLAKYAFQRFGDLTRIESYVFEGNDASARVLEKAGFVREGVLRKSVIKDDQLLDRWLYALIAE